MPLFLELLRQASEKDPQLARLALRGLRLYAEAERASPGEPKPDLVRVGPSALRDHGGTGPPLVLVPSLINPPDILDLDPETALTSALADSGRKILLLDWGAAGDRSQLGVAAHVAELLVPLLRQLDGTPVLIGYCLGGTMAVAAANHVRCERVATLAAPWRFSLYPADARAAIARIWEQSRDAAQALGALPMEVLQAAFWSLDPDRTVRKFARFAEVEPGSAQARRFVALEDWANEGDPLPFPAARELIEDLFGRDLPGRGDWTVGGRIVADRLDCPLLNLTAQHDRIAPAATAPSGECRSIAAGHVGMVVGSARRDLHAQLRRFLGKLAAGPSLG